MSETSPRSAWQTATTSTSSSSTTTWLRRLPTPSRRRSPASGATAASSTSVTGEFGLITGSRRWDELLGRFEGGFGDIAESVAYLTSHDAEKDGERRLMNHVLSSLLRDFDHGDGSFQQVRDIAEALHRDPQAVPEDIRSLYGQALDRIWSGHAPALALDESLDGTRTPAGRHAGPGSRRRLGQPVAPAVRRPGLRTPLTMLARAPAGQEGG